MINRDQNLKHVFSYMKKHGILDKEHLKAHCLTEIFCEDSRNGLAANRPTLEDYCEIHELMSKFDINHAFIKGIVWDFLFYGNLALRPFTDIDLLVAPNDVCVAKKILKSNGFRAGEYCGSDQEITFYDRRDALRRELYSHETAPLIRVQKANKEKAKILEVDLNFYFCWTGTQIPKEFLRDKTLEMLGRVTFLNMDGVNIPILSPEDMVLQTLCHSYNESKYFLLEDIRVGGISAGRKKKFFRKTLRLRNVFETMCVLKMYPDEVVKLRNDARFTHIVAFSISQVEYLSGSCKFGAGSFEKYDYFFDKNGTKYFWSSNVDERISENFDFEKEFVKLGVPSPFAE